MDSTTKWRAHYIAHYIVSSGRFRTQLLSFNFRSVFSQQSCIGMNELLVKNGRHLLRHLLYNAYDKHYNAHDNFC